MKVFILSALALLGAGSVSAQTYQELNRFELGINGGICRTSLPKGSLYTGTSTYWQSFGGARALYTIKEYFQVGLEVNATKWETTDDHVPITGLTGKPLGTDTVTYTFARPAISFLAHANVMIPLFKNYRFNNVANIHLGISGGPVAAINDGAQSTKVYGSADQDSSLKYLDRYAFKPGSGWAFGFQMGYTHYIKEHVGLGVEYAPRYYSINTLDSELAGRNSHFRLWSHALSLSIRYRW
ncbi:MAG: outer membrane beta-barrel protein [Flavipsychrobacter sp.]|nr:outer membrane beta-barrel protein [Flavipsychrobacter sp.]